MAEKTGDGLLLVTKGDRLASGSIYTFTSIVAARVATIISSIVIVRMLSPKDYGILSIVTLAISLAAVVATFQIPSALVKFLAAIPPNKPDEASNLIGAGLMLTTVTTILTVACLALLAPILAFGLYGEPQLWFLILMASVGLIVSGISSSFFAIFQGFERIKEQGTRNTIAALLTVPTTLTLVTLFGIQGAVLAMVANNVISILVSIAILRKIWLTRHLRIKVSRERHTYRKLLNYATPALASAVAVSLVLWVCSTILATSHSFIELGRYSAGYGLAGYLLFIPSSIGVPLVPIISRFHAEKSGEFPQFMGRNLRVMAFLCLPPTLLLVAWPEPFLTLLYGSPYLGAANVVRMVAPAIYIACVGSVVGYGMAGTGQMWGAFLLNGIWAVAVTGISIALIPAWGDSGLATAILLSYIILFIVAMTYSRVIWAVNLKPLAMMLSISFVSIPMASLASIHMGFLSIPFSVCIIVLASILGYMTLSKREIEVLHQPLRKVLAWIHKQD